jgi:hypothetical protein
MARQMIRIEGLDKALRVLKDIEGGAERATDTAVAAAALVVENKAKGKLRSGYLLRSGNLRRSITHKRTK